jgi:CheY-like chemotaxis protein
MEKLPEGLEETKIMFLFCSFGVKRDQTVRTCFPALSPDGDRPRTSDISGGRHDQLSASFPKSAGTGSAPSGEIRHPGTKTKSATYRVFAGSGQMGLCVSRRPVVLIVEDEFLLRMDAAEMIEAAGFEVVEAANADQAIQILEARPDITVIFTDIQMPGSMDGLKLARAVRGRWPPIKIVATSGRPNIGERDLPEGGRFLPKPYSPVQVTGVLRELTGMV